MKIKYYTDPGHGWGAVKRHVLEDLGIASQISRFSYQRGKTVYLEQDCDLPRLLTALSARGIWVEHVNRHTDRRSAIRSFAAYSG
jgi:hypothetical protein